MKPFSTDVPCLGEIDAASFVPLALAVFDDSIAAKAILVGQTEANVAQLARRFLENDGATDGDRARLPHKAPAKARVGLTLVSPNSFLPILKSAGEPHFVLYGYLPAKRRSWDAACKSQDSLP